MSTTFTAGQTVTNSTPFTSLNGNHFREGTRFTVDLVGDVNTRARSEGTDCVVWIENHYRQFGGTGLHGYGRPEAVAA